MSNKTLAVLLILLWAAAFSIDRRWGAATAKKERDYPKPGYIEYPKLNDDQLMYLARRIARQTETRSGNLGMIQPGQKGLVVVSDRQDMRIVKAAIQAVKERGAEADFMYTSHLLEISGLPKSWAQGERIDRLKEPAKAFVPQALIFRRYKKSYFSQAAWSQLPENANLVAEEAKKFDLKNQALKKYLDRHPEYCCVFPEWGGAEFQHRQFTAVLGRKYQKNWRYPTTTTLIREGQTPVEVWRILEQKIIDPIPWIRHVHVTDPEGTDIEYDVSAQEASDWRMGAYEQNYMRMYPFQGTRSLYLIAGIKRQMFPNANGIIASTEGMGIPIPYLKLTIEGGRIVKVEGGGIQGMLMNDIMQKYKDFLIPPAPRPGWAWVYHNDVTVDPKSPARDIEWGFGFETSLPESRKYEIDHDIPLNHSFHVDNRFPTYEATIIGGRKIKLIDKGYFSEVDDPEVRAIASKYGDPNVILSAERGAEPIPGINAPGDYWTFASNPIDYWLKERQLLASGKSPFINRLLPMDLQKLAEPSEASDYSKAKTVGSSFISFFGLN